MDHPSNVTNFIWCKPAEAPFNALPVLPLRYSKRLANTYYAADYFEEKMSAYIDNLNVAYVAFTRAGEELHIFAPRISNAGNSRRPNVDTDSNRTISGLLEDIVFADQKKEQGELRYETADEWHAGLMDEAKRKANETKPKKKREREVVAESAKAYTSITPGSRLRLRLQGSGVFGEEGERAYGTLMHRILAEVVRIEDIETTVDAFVRAGELSENEAQETCEKIRLWLDDERVRPWFASEIKVWNERTILQCDGTSCRPDRVVELPDEVVVIDYKFGRVERDDYKEKVSTYVDLIRQMGYPRVSGYLWYVTLDKIVPT